MNTPLFLVEIAIQIAIAVLLAAAWRMLFMVGPGFRATRRGRVATSGVLLASLSTTASLVLTPALFFADWAARRLDTMLAVSFVCFAASAFAFIMSVFGTIKIAVPAAIASALITVFWL